MTTRASADRGTQYLPFILGALVAAVTPHILRLPPWIIVWTISFWVYAWGIARRGWLTPAGKTRRVLTLCGAVGGLATYGFAFDLDAGVGLLTIMVGLKPLEIRNHRDRMMTLFLSYFLVITTLFYSNALGMTLYLTVSVFITTAVLIRINHTGGNLALCLRTTGRIMVLALPLTIGLFLTFPRMYTGLWGAPRPEAATIGFTDTLTPGGVSELVKDSAIAFRVKFEGPVPPPRDLYWRGIVFKQFDGRSWHPGGRTLRYLRTPAGTQPVVYSVTLEPHHQRWLFGLDRPFRSSRRTRIFSDGSLRTWRKVNTLFHYKVISYTRYNTGDLQPEDWSALDLPPDGNPESRKLARQWAAEADDPADIVKRALDYFQENRFRYTLQAAPAGPDIIDGFLFRTREGYCEHYASAFAFLMRAADVPARIVGGYLGGEKNPYADYLIIRQSDAHAWVEVWLPERGWTRVDPTSVIAPARVSQGMAAALASEERETLEPAYAYLGPLAGIWKKVQFAWDLADTHWSQWVIIYSRSEQRALFRGFGITTTGWRTPVAGLAFAGGIIALYFVGLVLVSRWRRHRRADQPTDQAQRAYLNFCERMARAGLPRAPFLGPRDYADRIMDARPDLARDIRPIIDLYIDIRYGRKQDKRHLRLLKSSVRRFAPAHAAPTVP